MFSQVNMIPLKEAVLTLQALPGRSDTYSIDKFPERRGKGTLVVNTTTISQDGFQSLCADNELHDQVLYTDKQSYILHTLTKKNARFYRGVCSRYLKAAGQDWQIL